MEQEIEIDLNEVAAFICNENFHKYLLENTSSFEVAAFILETLLAKLRLLGIDFTEKI